MPSESALSIPFAPEPSPGKWRFAAPVPAQHVGTIIFSCPVCGQEKMIDSVHITAAGYVARLVKCTTPGCGFLEQLHLRGYGSG